MKKVLKRDKSIEDFDANKIIKVVMAAGLSNNEAVILAENVNNYFKSSDHDLITSLDIRDKVIEELKKDYFYASGLYEWYQKTKEKGLQK